MKLTQRIKQDRIRLEWEYAEEIPEYVDAKFADNANWYDVTLKLGRRKLKTPYGMGIMLERMPEVADVMSSLIMDAQSVEDSEGIYQWAWEFGMNPTDLQTKRTYEACVKSAQKLREFLGDKYRAYLYETENDV